MERCVKSVSIKVFVRFNALNSKKVVSDSQVLKKARARQKSGNRDCSSRHRFHTPFQIVSSVDDQTTFGLSFAGVEKVNPSFEAL